VIAISILLEPSCIERFLMGFNSPRGICYLCMLSGLLQLYFLRDSKRKKVLVPICIGTIVAAFILFWTC